MGSKTTKARRPAGPAGAPSAAGDDPALRPWTGEDDLSAVEVVATSDDTEVSFRYCVDLDREETLLAVRARRVEDLDYIAIAKRAILDAARAALERAGSSVEPAR